MWALPALLALVTMLARFSKARPVAKAVAGLCVIVGGVHLASISIQMDGPITTTLLALNGASSFVVAFLALRGCRWRLPAISLAAATVASYAVYVVSGRDSADTVGVATALTELAIVAVSATHPNLP